MRVLIAADSEGQAGLVREPVLAEGGREKWMRRILRRPPAVTYGISQAEFNRQQMSREAAASARGALAAGASEVLVLDGGFIRGHSPVGLVIIPEMLPRGTKLAQGGIPLKVLASEGWDAAIFIGRHAKAGTRDGVMAHTYSNLSIEKLTINGQEVGEIAIEALQLGHYGISLVLLSGDVAACREAETLVPSLRTVPTKRGFGEHQAISFHVDDVCDRIERECRDVLQNGSDAKPLVWPAPFTVQLTCKSNAAAKRRALRHKAASTNGRTITYQANTALEIY